MIGKIRGRGGRMVDGDAVVEEAARRSRVILETALEVEIKQENPRDLATQIVDEGTAAILRCVQAEGIEIDTSPDGMIPRFCQNQSGEVSAIHVSREELIAIEERHLTRHGWPCLINRTSDDVKS